MGYSSFFTGVAVGVTLPFITGGVGALTYQSTKFPGKSGAKWCGVVGGFASLTFGAWSGHKLVQRYKIPFPKTMGFNEQQLLEFESGFENVVRSKRKASYTFGAILGFTIPVGLFLYALSQLGPIGV